MIEIFVGIDILQFVLLFLGTLMVVFWMSIYLMYKNKFDKVIKGLGKNEYFLSQIFFIGFGIMELFKYNINSKFSETRIKKISQIKGEKYAPYYNFIITGGQFTYIFTFLPMALFFGALANDFAITFVVFIFVALIVVYLDYEIKLKVDERKDEIINELPNILSKFALMLNAGMTVRGAWVYVSESKEGKLYDEMKIVNNEIQSGVTEIDAYKNFSERCDIKQIRKLTSVLIQNMQKGSSEIVQLIRDMSLESWQEKRANTKIKGEMASQKLLIPVGIMFISVLIIIIVPIFSSF